MKMLKEERELVSWLVHTFDLDKPNMNTRSNYGIKADFFRLLKKYERATRDDQKKIDALIESETAPCQECSDRIKKAIKGDTHE